MSLANTIKQRINLIQHVRETISLRKESIYDGYTIFSPCPFCQHNDSFSVRPDKYKCFSCESKGSIIDFHKSIFHLSPKEAILSLAEKYNIPTNEVNSNPAKKEKPPHIKILDHSKPLTKEQLTDYLEKRNFGPQREEAISVVTKTNNIRCVHRQNNPCLAVLLFRK